MSYSTAILKNLYKDGSKVKQLYYNGINVYRMLQKSYFSVNFTDMGWGSEGGTLNFTITSGDDWTLTYPEWVTVSQTKGIGTATVYVTAPSSDEDLEGDIVITSNGQQKTVHLYQESGGGGGDIDYSEEYLTIEVIGDGVLNWRAYGSNANSYTKAQRTIQYSKNNGDWVTITSASGNAMPTIDVVEGDVVRIKGEYNGSGATTSSYSSFSGSTATFNVYGNIMSLIYGDYFIGQTNIPQVGIFAALFSNCVGLIDASNLILPATTLKPNCYIRMFRKCRNLTTAPKLPVTNLANMCYQHMFYECKSLTQAPELPATTLADNCYNSMFNGCSNLNYIKCLANNISASGALYSWTNGVSTTGTFVKAAGVEWPTGTSGIPSGWTVEEV